jgi:cellobiose-specific phosphotransferase system component IIC
MKNIIQPQKSKHEIDEAVSNHDFTGGYNFISWVLYMRKFFIVALLFDFFAGYQLCKAYQAYEETPALIAAISFGLIIPVIIIVLLLREYKNLKRGKSQ